MSGGIHEKRDDGDIILLVDILRGFVCDISVEEVMKNSLTNLSWVVRL